MRAAFDVLTRAATTPASTSGWASQLGEAAVGDFVASLSPPSARLIAGGIQMPIGRRKSLSLPRRSGSKAVANSAFWVAEASDIPPIGYELTGATLGPSSKIGAIITMTRELAEHSGGLQIFGSLLREDFGATLDAAVLSTSDASPPVPGGILYDVTPNTADDGTNGPLAAIVADLSGLAGAIADAGGDVANVVFIAAPKQAAAANLWLPNRNLQILSSAALSDGTVVAVEKTAFVSGFGIEPNFTLTREAPIILQNPVTPMSIAGTPVAVPFPVVSTFQADLLAVRVELDVAYCMRAEGRVAVVNSVAW